MRIKDGSSYFVGDNKIQNKLNGRIFMDGWFVIYDNRPFSALDAGAGEVRGEGAVCSCELTCRWMSCYLWCLLSCPVLYVLLIFEFNCYSTT